MKALMTILLGFLFTQVFAQEVNEREITTEISEVTVFIDGAQIVRNKTIDFQKGITLLKFVNLSPFIEAKSVQVKANGAITVLAVNHQQDFLTELEKPKEAVAIESEIEAVNAQIELEKTYLTIVGEEVAFLRDNRVIGGKNNDVNVGVLKEASEFYGTKLTALMLKRIERESTLKQLEEKRNKLQSQLSILSGTKQYAQGEILVKIDAKATTSAKIELLYLVTNAGWYPSYDIRAKSITEPLEVVYKANLRQDTKIDWKNVKLKFSSVDPGTSGVAPELSPYFLNYNILPPVYKTQINSVSGRVVDQNNESVPGVSINIPGTSMGTISDIDGKYSIMLPADAHQLNFSFIGFKPLILPVSGPVLNVVMEEDIVAMEEVVAVGFGVVADDIEVALPGRMPGVSVRGASTLKGKKNESIAIPFEQTENQTSVEFEIKTPYSVKSDNNVYSVDMAVYEIPAMFQYYSVPKIDKNAFLLAYISDWEKYNLLEGEANVFFEGTFVGKTLLDVRFASDTLQVSLGKDKNVSVTRELKKEYTARRFIGANKEETRYWETLVKNNKSSEISMMILDQIPVSTLAEIEVEVLDISGGKLDKESGEVKWEFDLHAGKSKEMNLKYSVKYPKSKKLLLE
ncbi:DUF4139 domain-containing protein [Maribellus sp. CM-23]|uniref:DUF4139 domain-containing protein n=1 Tax=Maribellus sp. CM-23 TaxID=2781026 RepID=UPI001F2F3EAE|nr:mucoidy inhibitor MuiA family protein [Maribellus sp. CM-23]MCE4563034.1 DUF4139 domain-containing protein [Maribellus sp. CM-23]